MMVCTARESKGWDEDTPQPPTLRFQTPFNVFSTRASDKADHEAWKYIHLKLHFVGPLEPELLIWAKSRVSLTTGLETVIQIFSTYVNSIYVNCRKIVELTEDSLDT